MYSHEHDAKILLFPYRHKYNISFFAYIVVLLTYVNLTNFKTLYIGIFNPLIITQRTITY